MSLQYRLLFYSSTYIISLMEGLYIPKIRVISGYSYFWCYQFRVLRQLEEELEVDDLCEEILYHKIID